MKVVRWKEIAAEISTEVSLGKWPVGTVIPGEIELAGRFNVSRDTIRRALAELTAAGLFERRPHIGTRVKSRNRTGKFLSELDGIRDIDRYGNLHPRKIQNIAPFTPNVAEAERLSVEAGSAMLRFENIRIASKKHQDPVVVTYVYIFEEDKEAIQWAQKYPNELIVTAVESVSGKECMEVRQTFSATVMSKEVASYFNLSEGSPALKIIRNYLDAKGKCITASESYHPADRFSFSVSAKKRL